MPAPAPPSHKAAEAGTEVRLGGGNLPKWPVFNNHVTGREARTFTLRLF